MSKPSSTVRVAVTQAEPVWFDLAGAVAKTCDLIREAAANKAQLVAFPEVWIPGYPCWIWSRPLDFEMNVCYMQNALRLHSPEMDTLRACARQNGIAVSLGFAENDDDSLYIAQALVGADGELKVHRRKMKPTHMERTVFGDASAQCLASVASLPHLGAGGSGVRVGQLACWEHIQPLLKFHTIAQREQIHVAAWPSLSPHSGPAGPDLWSMSAEGCQALARTYAAEASAFVLHCTAVLTDKAVAANRTAGSPLMGAPGGGSSAIFGPDGRKLTKDLDDKAEGILYADLDMDEITRIKMLAHCTGHYSRPDLLWLSTDAEVKTLVRGATTTGAVAGRRQQQQQQQQPEEEEIVVVEKRQQS